MNRPQHRGDLKAPSLVVLPASRALATDTNILTARILLVVHLVVKISMVYVLIVALQDKATVRDGACLPCRWLGKGPNVGFTECLPSRLFDL
jgi:hypothetical protein